MLSSSIQKYTRKYSNLFLTFAFFLSVLHVTFRYESIICTEATGIIEIFCDFIPFV